MGAVTDALARAARGAGAELRTGAEVTAIDADGDGAEVRYRAAEREHARRARPRARQRRARRCSTACSARAARAPTPEGAQLKVNLLLARLPRLRDAAVDPREAFAGTFHVNETTRSCERAYDAGRRGRAARRCRRARSTATRSPTRASSGPSCAPPGAQTLTVFALHMPARLFAADPDGRASGCARGDARLARQRARRADRGLPAARRRRRAVHRGAHPARPRARAAACPAATSSTATSRGRSPRREAEVGTWGVETDDPRCCCAAPARGAAAASAASRGATRRWPCCAATVGAAARRAALAAIVAAKRAHPFCDRSRCCKGRAVRATRRARSRTTARAANRRRAPSLDEQLAAERRGTRRGPLTRATGYFRSAKRR